MYFIKIIIYVMYSMATPCLYIRHALVYSFIVFKFTKKKHFRENWIIFWGIWGGAELNLGIWGAKAKFFQGAEEILVRDLGRPVHYF